MASKDSQPKTHTQTTEAEAAKELEADPSSDVIDVVEDNVDPTPDELRVVLVGKTGMGKSSVGNSLLNIAKFREDDGAWAVTEKVEVGECKITVTGETKTLKVYDTPGMFNAAGSISDTMNQILECMTQTDPGPHIFLFIMKMERISNEHLEAIAFFKNRFGDKVLDYTIIIFTVKDHIEKSPDDWFKSAFEATSELKTFIKSCNMRYKSINNKGSDKKQDVDRILELIHQTITENRKNNCDFYTNSMCETAKKFYQQKQEKDEKEKEAKLRKKIESELRDKIREAEKIKIREKDRIKMREEDIIKIREEERRNILGQLPPELKQKVESALQTNIPSTSRDTDNQQESKPDTRERVRGPIKEPDRTILKQKTPELIKKLSDPNLLISSLIARGVFDDDDKEKVEKEIRNKTNKAGMTKLLEILQDCGSDALQLFMECLKDNNCVPALKLLESAIISDILLRNPAKSTPKDRSRLENMIDVAREKTRQLKFVKTRAYDRGCRVLSTDFVLGIVGETGDGKTTLAQMIGHQFLLQFPDFIPVLINDPDDLKVIPFEGKQPYLIIIDDMFGRFKTENNQLNNWSKYFEHIFLKTAKHKLAFIYIINEQTYQSIRYLHMKYVIFEAERCIFIHKPPLSLNKSEKLLIIKYHLGDIDEQSINKMINHDCFGFPQIVQMCCHIRLPSDLELLKSVFDFVKNEFELYWQKFKEKYACASYVFCQSEVRVSDIKNGFSSKIDSLETTIKDKVYTDFTESVVLDYCRILKESILCKTVNHDDIVYTMRENISEIFIIHFSDRFLNIILEFCPFQLLMKLVRTIDEANTQDTYVLIKSCSFQKLTSRFLDELNKNNFDILYHPSFLDCEFLSVFLEIDKSNLALNCPADMLLGCIHGNEDSGNIIQCMCILADIRCFTMIWSKCDKTDIVNLKSKLGYNLIGLAAVSQIDSIKKIELLKTVFANELLISDFDSSNKKTVVHLAAQSEIIDSFKHILALQPGVNVNQRDSELRTGLHDACDSEWDNVEIVMHLVAMGIDINSQDINEYTPLHLAANRGKVKTVEYLLEMKASVDIKDNKGRLPIHQSCRSNTGRLDIKTSDIVTQLLEAGSDVTSQDIEGKTPFDEAVCNVMPDTVEVILDTGFVQNKICKTTIQEANQLTNIKPLITKILKNVKYPLHEAASIVDNIQDFTDILDIYSDQINSLNSEGETVFTCAMLSASIPADKLKLLLKQGADIKLIQDKTSRENIIQMCKSSPISVLQFLIDKKLITISNFSPEVLFQVCISDIDPVDKLDILLSNGCDLYVKYKYRSLLHTACESSSLDTVRYLINKGLGCNDKDRDDRTPLYYCMSDKDTVDKLEVLLSKGGDLHVKDGYNRGLLHTACQSGSLDTVKYLINKGLGCNDKDRFGGQTPLYYCCKSDKDAVGKLEVLLSNGDDLHVNDDYKRGLLHIACRSGNLDTVKYLIHHGLGTNDKDRFGQTPLYHCCISDKDPVDKLEVLLSNGGDAHVKYKHNRSLLHIACMSGSLKTVRYLINEGLGCNDTARYNRTPLYYCCKSHKDPVDKFKYLVSAGAEITENEERDYIQNNRSADLKTYLKTTKRSI